MRIGVPREVKVHEYRVAITPAGVRELREAGHDVLVEAGAGEGSSISEGIGVGRIEEGRERLPDQILGRVARRRLARRGRRGEAGGGVGLWRRHRQR